MTLRRYRTFPWLEEGWRDLRFAVRSLARMPGFTSIALLETGANPINRREGGLHGRAGDVVDAKSLSAAQDPNVAAIENVRVARHSDNREIVNREGDRRTAYVVRD